MAENKYAKFMEDDFSLLNELKEKAPGTYKHSRNVMDICTRAAAELNLDKDLLACACLYHDIGKIVGSQWFTENQMDGDYNPHDDVDVWFSVEKLTRHVSDSAMILAQHDFPLEVIKIVSSHHGTSPLLHFWRKSGGKEEDKDKFRYYGMPPQDEHSCVLMICDRVEATAKSLYGSGNLKNAADRDKLIEDVISDLIDDGQIDNLTIKVLKIIKNILKSELSAIYSDRVSYDEVAQNGDDKKSSEE